MLRTDSHPNPRRRADDDRAEGAKPDAAGLRADMEAAMREALRGNPRARHGAVVAFLDHVRRLDPALSWPLHTEEEHQRAAERLMRDVRAQMAREEAAKRQPPKMLVGPAPVSEGGEGRLNLDREVHSGTALAPTPSAPAQAAPVAQPSRAALTTKAMTQAAATVWKGLLAERFVKGKPLGDMTGAEAVAAGRAAFGRARGDVMVGRFLVVLATGLPPADPIGRWTTPAVAADVWQKAQAWAREKERHDAS
jgi:hypothetical protein